MPGGHDDISAGQIVHRKLWGSFPIISPIVPLIWATRSGYTLWITCNKPAACPSHASSLLPLPAIEAERRCP
jgi:hypothetical protein